MKRKTTTTDLKNSIRKKYESGQDLIDLAIEYKVNYGTLRNIASREQWKKGILKDLIRVKELENLTKKAIKEKEKRKNIYKDLTNGAVEDLQLLEKLDMEMYVTLGEEKKSFAETKATVVKLRTSAIKELYNIDKELYEILSPSEEQDLMLKKLKYEELKKKAGYIDKESEENNDIIID